MHVCLYVCTYLFIYACMHVCMYVCMHVCMYASMHLCLCTYHYAPRFGIVGIDWLHSTQPRAYKHHDDEGDYGDVDDYNVAAADDDDDDDDDACMSLHGFL